MNYSKLITAAIICILCLGIKEASAQQPAPGDTTKQVIILPGLRKLELLKINDTTELQVLAGNVRLRQGNTLFTCDSCVINNSTHILQAFGRVHINDSDTADVYADYLKYLIDKRVAYFSNHVKLTDGKGVLTTNNLEYNLETKLGIYTNGGRVVNKGSVLTSDEGYYYADLKDIYFKKHVLLKDPSYTLITDSLLYNTETEVARFIAETNIIDSSHKTITTSEGFYDTRNRKAEFRGRPVVHDGATTYSGNTITTNDSTGISQIVGNAYIRDTAEGRTVAGGHIIANRKNQSFIAFNKPLMIVKQDQDSIYITADTLFSARLSDLPGKKDSVKKEVIKGVKVVDTKSQDSANRYFIAYNHVRIFSDSLQAVSDSMYYSFKDSVFRLFQHPVVWSRGSQVTGDTILVFTKNKKAERFKVIGNSYLVSKVQGEMYNQVRSTRMDGYLTDGALDSVRARGFAECIYYIQDEDSAFTGINESSADILDIYFAKQELHKVVFRSAVKGTVWPIRSKSPSEMRLKNFQWLDARRPKTKFELYE
jgi:lipopolysaccharide export system protein LptA